MGKQCPDCGVIYPEEPHEIWCVAYSFQKRAEAAEARVAELEARIEALETEVMQQHHIASACAEAEA